MEPSRGQLSVVRRENPVSCPLLSLKCPINASDQCHRKMLVGCWSWKCSSRSFISIAQRRRKEKIPAQREEADRRGEESKENARKTHNPEPGKQISSRHIASCRVQGKQASLVLTKTLRRTAVPGTDGWQSCIDLRLWVVDRNLCILSVVRSHFSHWCSMREAVIRSRTVRLERSWCESAAIHASVWELAPPLTRDRPVLGQAVICMIERS